MRLDENGRLLIKELHSKKDGRVARLYYGNMLIFEDTGEVGSVSEEAYRNELEKWKSKNSITDVEEYIRQAKLLDEKEAQEIAEQKRLEREAEEARKKAEEEEKLNEIKIYTMVPQVSTERPKEAAEQETPENRISENSNGNKISENSNGSQNELNETAEIDKKPTETTQEPQKEPQPENKSSYTENDKKPNKGIYIAVMVLLLAVSLAIVGYFTGFLKVPISNGNKPSSSDTASTNENTNNDTPESITVIRAMTDIPSGTEITADMLGSYTITSDEFTAMSGTTYIAKDGSTSNSPLVMAKEASNVVGAFATKDIKKDRYITADDYSTQKVIAEKTYVDVDVNGETITVPVDSAVSASTSVKIVALITTDGQEGTTAVTLAEFVMKDRTLEDIFNSAGQSILEQIATQKSETDLTGANTETNTEQSKTQNSETSRGNP